LQDKKGNEKPFNKPPYAESLSSFRHQVLNWLQYYLIPVELMQETDDRREETMADGGWP
jgi:hypothetical protein